MDESDFLSLADFELYPEPTDEDIDKLARRIGEFIENDMARADDYPDIEMDEYVEGVLSVNELNSAP